MGAGDVRETVAGRAPVRRRVGERPNTLMWTEAGREAESRIASYSSPQTHCCPGAEAGIGEHRAVALTSTSASGAPASSAARIHKNHYPGKYREAKYAEGDKRGVPGKLRHDQRSREQRRQREIKSGESARQRLRALDRRVEITYRRVRNSPAPPSPRLQAAADHQRREQSSQAPWRTEVSA